MHNNYTFTWYVLCIITIHSLAFGMYYGKFSCLYFYYILKQTIESATAKPFIRTKKIHMSGTV